MSVAIWAESCAYLLQWLFGMLSASFIQHCLTSGALLFQDCSENGNLPADVSAVSAFRSSVPSIPSARVHEAQVPEGRAGWSLRESLSACFVRKALVHARY